MRPAPKRRTVAGLAERGQDGKADEVRQAEVRLYPLPRPRPEGPMKTRESRVYDT